MIRNDFERLVNCKKSNSLDARMIGDSATQDIISFLGAEIHYPVAPVISDALVRMAQNGRFGYTVMDEPYINAVIWWMNNARGFSIQPEWIVPTLGVIHSVSVAIRLFLDIGDAIIITPPVYNRYEQAAARLGRKTIKCPLLPGADRYRIDFDKVEQAMKREDTKLFILCNPHNPIGQIWTVSDLEQLANLSNHYHVPVFSDEIFAENSLQNRRCPSYLTIRGAADNCIVATSLGKAFGTTGFNHANMIIPNARLRDAFTDRRTREHYGSMDPVAYETLVAAYSQEGLQWIQESNSVMERNMNIVKGAFKQSISDVPVLGGEGGYILWIDWRSRFTDEPTLMNFLYKKAHFYLDAGSHYGSERFTRMSLACPTRYVNDALDRLIRILQNSERAVFDGMQVIQDP